MSYCERCGEDHDTRVNCDRCGLEMCGDCMTEREFQSQVCRVCAAYAEGEEMKGHNGAMPLNLEYIRQRREQLGLTHAEAAERAGFPNRQKWYQYEAGHIPDPQLSSLEAIAMALRCGVAKLIK